MCAPFKYFVFLKKKIKNFPPIEPTVSTAPFIQGPRGNAEG